MKRKYWIFLPFLILLVYFAGPKVEEPILLSNAPTVPADLKELESWVRNKEDTTRFIKPDNQARIVWAEKPYQKTKYGLIYLHGWSASQAEGAPIHREIAERYGMNLYLARLYGHGLQENVALKGMTAEKLLNSAREAIAVASELADSLILFGTSTGGTLSLYLAPEVANSNAMILYSPNIRIYESTAFLLDEPWGYEIARLVTGSDYHSWETDPERLPYWSNKYPLRALTHLEALVTATMNRETFEKVTVPVFLGYYYKNDSMQDHTVSVPAMLEMFEELGTPERMKRKQAFPNAGAHVIGSYLVTEDLPSVELATFQFIEEILGIQPVQSDSASSSTSGISHSE